MLALVIFLSVVIIATTVIFAIRLLNVTNSIDDLTARVNMLHDKYCNHEDRIDCNYKSLAELNRRQDEWMRQHTEEAGTMTASIRALNKEIQALQEKKTAPKGGASTKHKNP